jgi:site-specific DNA-methyltransferase (adenine-specific)
MRTMPDNSVDAVVTDSPYGLAFMGKKWDYDVPSVAIWEQCLRVLKPGGHLLAFAGTRTQHRMACRIEDAGFEIRDMIAWVYGSGFPKSLDVSKAIDKAAGALRHEGKNFRADGGSGTASYRPTINPRAYTPPAPATPEAQQWSGWGTALKPALEPITMARKPLAGTVAANVLEHGTGALNVDGCRVGIEDMSGQWDREWSDNRGEMGSRYPQTGRVAGKTVPPGRWPANLLHDGSDEVVGLFPMTTSGGGNGIRSELPNTCMSGKNYARVTVDGQPPSSGSAARFFYTAKASRDDRDDGNTHPTVKPTDLMRYLCRLATPPGGVVLDPFMGSGSTGKAAMLEGFEFIGIEREPSYHAIAEQRISRAAAAGYQPSLLP